MAEKQSGSNLIDKKEELINQGPQQNWESVDREKSSSRNNVDDNENAISNGTQSKAPQPGIATVGNTGSESAD